MTLIGADIAELGALAWRAGVSDSIDIDREGEVETVDSDRLRTEIQAQFDTAGRN